MKPLSAFTLIGLPVVRKGFTLIELLVVIAVIALLISIFLPSLEAAKEIARCVVCTTKLRNLGLAVNFYANENDEYLPAAGPRDRGLINKQYWFMNANLLRYVGVSLSYDAEGTLIGPPAKKSALTCPSHCKPMRPRKGGPREYALSYVMNGTFGVGDWCSIEREYRRVSDFEKPAGVMIFADGNNSRPETVGTVLYHGCPRENFGYRHKDSLNAAFLDSHVVKLESGDIPLGRDKRFEPFWSEKKP